MNQPNYYDYLQWLDQQKMQMTQPMNQQMNQNVNQPILAYVANRTAEGSYGRRMPEYYGRMFGGHDWDGDDRHYEGHHYYDDRRIDGRMYGRNQDIIDSLHKDLQNATSEQEREYIRNMIRKYEK